MMIRPPELEQSLAQLTVRPLMLPAALEDRRPVGRAVKLKEGTRDLDEEPPSGRARECVFVEASLPPTALASPPLLFREIGGIGGKTEAAAGDPAQREQPIAAREVRRPCTGRTRPAGSDLERTIEHEVGPIGRPNATTGRRDQDQRHRP